MVQEVIINVRVTVLRNEGATVTKIQSPCCDGAYIVLEKAIIVIISQ